MSNKGIPHHRSRASRVREMIRAGRSNAEIYAAIPVDDLAVLKTQVSQQRRRLQRCDPAGDMRRKVWLPVDVLNRLDTAAWRRGDDNEGAAQRLALRLITTILRDDMIDAVLDDEPVLMAGPVASAARGDQ